MASTKLSCMLLCCAAMVWQTAAPFPAGAAQVFSTTLSGAGENPPVATDGSGSGSLTLADDMNSFSVLITFSGLTTNAVAGHVHCCAPLGTNAPEAIGFTVPSDTTGTISGVYDLTLASTYNGAFLAGAGGTAAGARSTFLAGLTGGLAYFNVHTINNPGGEIRGQLPAVPEPATWAMMLTGFGIVGAGLRFGRRRHTASLV